MSLVNRAIGAAVQVARAEPELRKLRDASDGLEAHFFREMLSAMRRGMPTGEEKGFGGGVYRDMFDNAVAESLAKSGSLGIGNLIFERMAPRAIQEAQSRLKAEAGNPPNGAEEA